VDECANHRVLRRDVAPTCHAVLSRSVLRGAVAKAEDEADNRVVLSRRSLAEVGSRRRRRVIEKDHEFRDCVVMSLRGSETTEAIRPRAHGREAIS
jgi:hypothetical protein